MTKPFTTPFAENGDVMFIPETAQPDGSVSYETGFGPDYSADPLEANAKPVPRAGHNELFNQITGSIGDIQRQGAADWYLEFSADGGYPKNAIVWLDGDRWKSQVDGNTTRPNIDEIAWLPSAKFEGGGGGGGGDFGLTGPTTIAVGGSFQYKISPYSSFMTYAVSATNGTATISGDTITLTIAPGETANVTDLTVIRSDGARNDFRIAIGAQSIAKPSMLSPASGSVDAPLGPLLTASAFMTYPDGADTHLNTDWRIRTMAGAVVWQSLANAVNKTNIQVPDNTLPLNTQLQADVRYRGTTLPVSAWSDAVTFTTTNKSILTPTITAPLNGATGITETPTFTSSAFATNPLGADTHASSDWSLKNSAGVVIWSLVASTTSKTTLTLPKGVLAVSTQYTMEVRYNGSILQPSAWSPVVSFTTKAAFDFGKYLASSCAGNPYVNSWGQNVDTFQPIALPAATSGADQGAAYSPDGQYLAYVGQSDPRFVVYKRTGDAYVRLATPPVTFTRAAGVSFSPDSNYALVAMENPPFLVYLKRAGDAFNPLTNLGIAAAGDSRAVAFSPDGLFVAVATTTQIRVSSRVGDTLTATVSYDTNYRTLAVAFSPDNNYLAYGTIEGSFFQVRKKVSGAYGTLLSIDTPPPGRVNGVAWSADGVHIALACGVAPYIALYKRSGDTLTKIANPNPAPDGYASACAFSGDGQNLAVAHAGGSCLTVYKRSGDIYSKLSAPAVKLLATGTGVAYYPPVLGR